MKHLLVFILLSVVAGSSYAGRFLPSKGKPVGNQFIVVLKDDAFSLQAREALLRKLAKQHGAEVTHIYNVVLNGGVMRMPGSKAEALAQNPLVDYVEQDSVVQLIVPSVIVPSLNAPSAIVASDFTTESPVPSWGLDRIDQQKLSLDNSYSFNSLGTAVTAYVIDTGIFKSHSDFANEFDPNATRASISTDTVGDGQNGIDCNGHGTHVAGIIGGLRYGVAKNVNLVAVRVLDCNGSGSWSGVIAGVDWVTEKAVFPAVANMSMAGTASTAVDTAVANSIAAGITYTIAAGNSNRDACLVSPARVPAALTVAATTNTDERASYSNYGTCVDIFAPGSSITSAWNTSTTATATLSGTSMSAPHVDGVAALYLQNHPDATPSNVGDAILKYATKRVVTNAGKRTTTSVVYSLIPIDPAQ